MKWFLKCYKQYADFSGRARRKEYWFFTLFYLIISFILIILWLVPFARYCVGANVLDADDLMLVDPEGFMKAIFNPYFFVLVIYWLGTLIPNIAVLVRRLHDIGRSGLWAILLYGLPMLLNFFNNTLNNTVVTLALLLPSLGLLIWYLAWCFTDSQPGENKYGPNPKEMVNGEL